MKCMDEKFVLATIPNFVVGDNDIFSCRLQTLQQYREKGTIGAPAVRKVVGGQGSKVAKAPFVLNVNKASVISSFLWLIQLIYL